MMRKLFAFAMVAGLVGMGGFARDARAGATIDLLFVGVNGGAIAATNAVTVAPSSTLTMAVLLTNDQTLTAAVYSLNYDLEGNDTLDVLAQFGWSGVGIAGGAVFKALSPLQPPTPTFIGSFQGLTSQLSPVKTLPKSGGAFAGGYQMGTVVWHVNGGPPGTQVLSGAFNGGIDAFGDGAFNDITNLVEFRSASVNFIPEPGTASLLGLGLVGLVLMGRRNR